MTIDEAIKTLSEESFGNRWPTPKAEVDAVKLGIEALIRVRDDRGTSYQPVWYPLPSETEE